ncbi:hypothetical protein Q5X61_10620 [Acinetobacter baumannii]|nr:hypothetical protein [Acinetobacter baumannii]
MNVKSREQHFIDHECDFDANDIAEALAIHLAKHVNVDLNAEGVTYTVHVTTSPLTGISQATVRLKETMVDVNGFAKDGEGE